jgi:hypothetical protein
MTPKKIIDTVWKDEKLRTGAILIYFTFLFVNVYIAATHQELVCNSVLQETKKYGVPIAPNWMSYLPTPIPPTPQPTSSYRVEQALGLPCFTCQGNKNGP